MVNGTRRVVEIDVLVVTAYEESATSGLLHRSLVEESRVASGQQTGVRANETVNVAGEICVGAGNRAAVTNVGCLCLPGKRQEKVEREATGE